MNPSSAQNRDLLIQSIEIRELGVTVEVQYRLNFDAEKICGFAHVYDTSHKDAEEIFEIYKEYYECSLTEDQIIERFNVLVKDIREGRLSVSL